MSASENGNKRIAAIASQYHNASVTEIEESNNWHSAIPSAMDVSDQVPLDWLKDKLKGLGLKIEKVHGGWHISEYELGEALKPGWIQMKDYCAKYGMHKSKFRQLIGDAPDAIKKKVNGGWCVNEVLFKCYSSTKYKYG